MLMKDILLMITEQLLFYWTFQVL